jgi:hypothetical protein
VLTSWSVVGPWFGALPIPLVTASSDDVLAEALRYGLGFWLHATGPGISWGPLFGWWVMISNSLR